MSRTFIVGPLIFLLVFENILLLKYLGFLLTFVVFILFLLTDKVKFSFSKFKSLTTLFLPFFYCALISLSCISISYSVLSGLAIKLLSCYIIYLFFSINDIAKGIKFAIYAHCWVFLIHVVFLFLGQGAIYNTIVGFEAQTTFGGSSYIPFRATGLFDEPSLFGMTMLCLIFSFFLLKNKFILVNLPFLTFHFQRC